MQSGLSPKYRIKPFVKWPIWRLTECEGIILRCIDRKRFVRIECACNSLRIVFNCVMSCISGAESVNSATKELTDKVNSNKSIAVVI